MNTPTDAAIPTPTGTLTLAARELAQFSAELIELKKNYEAESSRLNTAIMNRRAILSVAHHGFDPNKVALAKSVIYVTDYRQGGADWRGCITDAVNFLATGKGKYTSHYDNLWCCYYGTKNYDRWQGQRSDHEYGYGPRHGSNCFEVGLTSSARSRDPRELTPEETEAAIYYLLNVVAIQDAERKQEAVIS